MPKGVPYGELHIDPDHRWVAGFRRADDVLAYLIAAGRALKVTTWETTVGEHRWEIWEPKV